MTESPTDVPGFRDSTLFGAQSSITSFKSDPILWNEGWTRLISTLSSKDAYNTLRPKWSQDGWDHPTLVDIMPSLKDRVRPIQDLVVKVWDHTQLKSDFVAAWLFLGEQDRLNHMVKGLQDSSRYAMLAQDARAICPEVETGSMQNMGGRAFVSFFASYSDGVKAAGENDVYLLPNKWWDGAAIGLSGQPLEKVVFELLSIQRNEFISYFLTHTVMSVMDDLRNGSTTMDPFRDIIKTGFGRVFGKLMVDMPATPLIRCENCTRSPKEIGNGVKFMLCSVCKTKLGFAVNYCSKECQKKDWRSHKQYCGKTKVTKQLAGTERDPYWRHPDIPRENLAPLPPPRNGKTEVTDVGFGTPHPSSPHTPALQRQVALMEGDKNVDYFVFDNAGHPIPFIIDDQSTKMVFRLVRSDAMFTPWRDGGVEFIAEYLIAKMNNEPRVNQGLILAQLGEEYGVDLEEKMVEFERKRKTQGPEPGTTFVEMMCKGFALSQPTIDAASGVAK